MRVREVFGNKLYWYYWFVCVDNNKIISRCLIAYYSRRTNPHLDIRVNLSHVMLGQCLVVSIIQMVA